MRRGRPAQWGGPAFFGVLLSVSAYFHRERARLLRFLVVGSLSVAADGLLFWWLRRGAGWSASLAKAGSYVAGMLLGFVLNKVWTFGSRRRSAAEPLTYGLLYAATLGLNVLAYNTVRDGLNAWGDRVAGGAAFLAATGLSTVVNYLGLRYFTFKRGIDERSAAEGVR